MRIYVDTVSSCDRQTDRQTDGFIIINYADERETFGSDPRYIADKIRIVSGSLERSQY